MKKLIENSLLSTRYLIVPLYFGLICYLALYNISFFISLWECAKECWDNGLQGKELSEILKLAAVDGVDSVMISQLILMVTIGSQSIFINEIETTEKDIMDHDRPRKLPRFLKNMSSGLLKLKMASSLVGITAVHLLVSFVNIKTIGWDNLLKESLIHFLFIVSAFAFAKIEIMTHPPEQHNH